MPTNTGTDLAALAERYMLSEPDCLTCGSPGTTALWFFGARD